VGIPGEAKRSSRLTTLSSIVPSFLAMASAQPQIKTEPTNEAANIISALGKAFKGQNGAPLTGDQLALWLHQNMAQLTMLVKEGKLTQGQILAVRNRCRLSSLRESVWSVTCSCGHPSFSFVSFRFV